MEISIFIKTYVGSIGFVDHLPIPGDSSTTAGDSTRGIRHFRHMDCPLRKDSDNVR